MRVEELYIVSKVSSLSHKRRVIAVTYILGEHLTFLAKILTYLLTYLLHGAESFLSS